MCPLQCRVHCKESLCFKIFLYKFQAQINEVLNYHQGDHILIEKSTFFTLPHIKIMLNPHSYESLIYTVHMHQFFAFIFQLFINKFYPFTFLFPFTVPLFLLFSQFLSFFTFSLLLWYFPILDIFPQTTWAHIPLSICFPIQAPLIAIKKEE